MNKAINTSGPDWFDYSGDSGVMARWVPAMFSTGPALQLYYWHPLGYDLGDQLIADDSLSRIDALALFREVYDVTTLTSPHPSIFHWGPEHGQEILDNAV